MASGASTLPDDLGAALAARRARLGRLASRVVYFETTTSTNDVADRLASDGASHGTVVFADAQQSGRGRLGRTWFSPPGAGLYVSVVLRPEELWRVSTPAAAGFHEEDDHRDAHEGDSDSRSSDSDSRSYVASGFSRTSDVSFASAVSLTAGVALTEGIRAACGLDVVIKWPNDLVIDRRKLCGILAEASSRSGELQHVILGYGINVRPAAYPPDIADRATSLETELGREVDRATVLAETLASLSEWLERARPAFAGASARPRPSASRRGTGSGDAAVSAGGDCNRGLAAVLDRWRQLSPSSVGASVEVVRPGGKWAAATTAGVDDDGALLARIGGTTERVIAGEVRWLGQ